MQGNNVLARAVPLTCLPQFEAAAQHNTVRNCSIHNIKKNAASAPNGIGVAEGVPNSTQTNPSQTTVTVMSALHNTLPARNASNEVRMTKPSSLIWEGVVEVPVGVAEVVVRLAVVQDSMKDGRDTQEEATIPTAMSSLLASASPSFPSSPSSPSSPLSPRSPTPVRNPEWTLVKYAKETHTIRLGDVPLDVFATCTWVDASHPGGVLEAAAFANVFCKAKEGAEDAVSAKPPEQVPACEDAGGWIHVTLEVMDWEVEERSNGSSLCVTGGNKALGNWQAKQVVWMEKVKPGHWRIELDLPASGFPITYKYATGVRNSPDASTADLILEPGESRLLVAPDAMLPTCSTVRT